jgi:chromosome segregation ATPase
MKGNSCKRKTRIEVEEERDELLIERDNLLKRCRELATERDDQNMLEEELRGEVLRIEDEQEILQGEFDDMQHERDDLDEELDELTARCDMIEQERDEALESLEAYEK